MNRRLAPPGDRVVSVHFFGFAACSSVEEAHTQGLKLITNKNNNKCWVTVGS